VAGSESLYIQIWLRIKEKLRMRISNIALHEE
jgi:hypothetical protein